ncbi:hypothetical protein V5799_022953 [Amblyomma americanum]|uniref:Reverse transcriptase domain-containing protein n=1 Tax=Amblyomma americanum TaxID=6943 RepID=A0AAQ4FJN0_AMBAM
MSPERMIFFSHRVIRLLSLRDVVKEDYSSFLYSLPGVLEVRINRQRIIIAVDVSSEESLAGLMGLRLLLSTPVRAFEASRFDGHIGTIFSVDPAVPDKGIADIIEASVLSIRRRDGAVTIRFGAAPLDWIQIAGLQFLVRPFKSRPLQCSQCGSPLLDDPLFRQAYPVLSQLCVMHHHPPDGLTSQMLRNRDAPEGARLLDAFNSIWDSGILPESWSTAVVVPIRKARKPPRALSSYRPFSLTSAACKSLKFVALQRLSWMASACGFLSECQTGFRRHRCTADSIADVASCREEAKQQGDVALLVLLDVQAAFDSLPYSSIEQALDELGVTARLRQFVTAFHSNRSMQVRIGGTMSSSRPITTGVPQGSVLSPLLFNLVKAGLPSAIQQGLCHMVFCSVYADDVALCVWASRRHIASARQALQRALDEVQCFLASRGLVLSATKSEALFVHPRGARATSRIRTLRIDGTDLPWRQQVRYLDLTINHRLTWIPADKPLLLLLDRVGRAAERLLARGNGCSSTSDIRLFEAAGTSAVLYALPLVTLRTTRLRRIETSRRK